jgi:hypothetical protein
MTWQVFWLTWLLNAFPLLQWQIVQNMFRKKADQDNSYGDSAGFTPTSLLIPYIREPNLPQI